MQLVLGVELRVRWGVGLLGRGRAGVVVVDHGPDPGGVVGGTGREEADVGGQKDPADEGVVRFEGCYGYEVGGVSALDDSPDVDVALGRL